MSQTITLTTDEIRQAIWFAAAEAFSQGYSLPDEQGAFLNHLSGSGRQYFMMKGAHPFIQMWAGPSDDGIASVSIFEIWRGIEREIMRETISAP